MSHVQQLFNGGESAGTFQLNFNNNRAYELFGREYLKCYANLSAKGKMSKPLPTGPLSYTVDFAMDCGCSSVLFDFNLAYKKTFGNQLQAPCGASRTTRPSWCSASWCARHRPTA